MIQGLMTINIPLIYLAWKYAECLGETSINYCYNEMNCVIKRKYWEKIYGCFILMKYVNKILVEEKCYSCEEKNHEQNNAYQWDSYGTETLNMKDNSVKNDNDTQWWLIQHVNWMKVIGIPMYIRYMYLLSKMR